MRKLEGRLVRLETIHSDANRPISDISRATDQQLEAYLRSTGIDPNDDQALVAAAAKRT